MRTHHNLLPGSLVTFDTPCKEHWLHDVAGTEEDCLGFPVAPQRTPARVVCVIVTIKHVIKPVTKNRERKTFIITSSGQVGWVWSSWLVPV